MESHNDTIGHSSSQNSCDVLDGFQCRKCGEWKPADAFEKSVRTSTGRCPRCRDCSRTNNRIVQKFGIDPVDGKLQCLVCGEVKPLDLFKKCKVSKCGRARRCNSCAVDEVRERHSVSPEKFLHFIGSALKRTTEKSKSGKRSDPSFSTEMLCRERLMDLWNSQNGKCALTGEQMTHKMGGRQWLNASIDRIDPAKGYEPGNVRLTCVAVNLMRRDMTDDEFFFWINKLSGQKKAVNSPALAWII